MTISKRKRKFIDDDVEMSIRERVLKYLRKTAPGIFASMNYYCITRYHMEFIDLLLEEPSLAYQALVEFFGNEDSAEFLMHRILERIFKFNPFYTVAAIVALKGGNSDKFKRLLAEFLP